MKKTAWIGMLAGVLCLLTLNAANGMTGDIEAGQNEARPADVIKAEEPPIVITDTLSSTAEGVEIAANDWAGESVSLLSLGAGLLFAGRALRGHRKKRIEDAVLIANALECEYNSCR